MSTQKAKVTSAFVLEGQVVRPGKVVELKTTQLKEMLRRGKVEIAEDKPKSTRNSNKTNNKKPASKPDASEQEESKSEANPDADEK